MLHRGNITITGLEDINRHPTVSVKLENGNVWLTKHELARLFEGVAAVEKEHEARYRKLIERINAGEVFKRGEVHAWKCNNCGHIHIGTEAPEVCPVCAHPKAHFEIRAENY